MAKEKEIPLKIELLSDGEDSEFRIHSNKEIQLIRAALREPDHSRHFTTTMKMISHHDLAAWS